ncbi:MAG: glucosamine-6-phosphate isomerase [Bacteroidales bacterium]|nr:MAG: glucosamine-6-phosphate isomerase [Bacteroidales bacterium]
MTSANSLKSSQAKTVFTSSVEKAFLNASGLPNPSTQIPYICVDNFPKLGLLTSLRFLEWVTENPMGVISLPTGKTPEFFIKWTKFLLENWDNDSGRALKSQYGFNLKQRPNLKNLQFIQIDEFYPISSKQKNSFYDYVLNYYIKGFDLDLNNALLINCDQIPLVDGKHFNEIFPDLRVDLSLRYRECRSKIEEKQQKSIFMIDSWCSDYEQKIRDKGGIGFFLGGLGPDGHIAFNVKGSDIHSTTRLTETNFETQAVAASDLGGIEISKNRLVITIGLETISYNPDSVAIIIVAGEAKARMVKDALENPICNLYPATTLSKLSNSRFYVTSGAAVQLNDTIDRYFKTQPWSSAKTEHAIINLCKKIDKYGHNLTIDDLNQNEHCKLIPNLTGDTVKLVCDSIEKKIFRGMQSEKNQVFLHTGPHHDDIMLGILPFITNHIRIQSNKFHFTVLTSGFTAVTNKFVIDILNETKELLDINTIQMVNYPDFFEKGYKYKFDKDVYHYLTKVAAGDYSQRRRGVCHRIVRALVDIYAIQNKKQLYQVIDSVLQTLMNSYNGEKNPPQVQRLKGMIREFEEELVWAHYGVQVQNVHHARLGFYKGDIFTEQPETERDVEPILNMLREINPTVVSLTFDPEGSGPDTHYKVLQAIAEAIRLWSLEKDLTGLRIWGYRNVWYRFNPVEANIIYPVSLETMASMNESFSACYVSQVEASFPSYELNGKFSALAQKIWVDQLQDIQLLMGKNYFYQNSHPQIRASHGLLYVKEMTVDEFLSSAQQLKKSMEGMVE